MKNLDQIIEFRSFWKDLVRIIDAKTEGWITIHHEKANGKKGKGQHVYLENGKLYTSNRKKRKKINKIKSEKLASGPTSTGTSTTGTPSTTVPSKNTPSSSPSIGTKSYNPPHMTENKHFNTMLGSKVGKKIINKYKNARPQERDLYRFMGDQLEILDANAQSTQAVVFIENGEAKTGMLFTKERAEDLSAVLHEAGHSYDRILSKYLNGDVMLENCFTDSYKMKDGPFKDMTFLDVLEEAYNEWYNEEITIFKKKHKISQNQTFEQEMSRRLVRKNYLMVSDMFDGLSNGAIRGLADHSRRRPKYWKNRKRISREVFANMHSGQVRNDPDLRFFKNNKHFKKVLDFYDNMMLDINGQLLNKFEGNRKKVIQVLKNTLNKKSGFKGDKKYGDFKKNKKKYTSRRGINKRRIRE